MILDLDLSAADAVELDEVDVGVGIVCFGASAIGLSEIAIFAGGGLGYCGNSGGSRSVQLW